jgi:phosphoribosylanthranilate isomerase
MPPDVKICGLTTPEAVAAAVSGGARLVGFVFFPPSPRSLAPSQAAALTTAVPAGVTRVGLFVDADDAFIDAVLAEASLDMLQFHGHESVERVRDARRRTGLAVMKAISIAGPEDLETARAYEGVADRLLFDAKPPKGASRPGGNALAFDWELLGGRAWRLPWMLAGGLDAANVAEAMRISGARAVDVSSGVEDAPGVKNLEKIREFLEACLSG